MGSEMCIRDRIKSGEKPALRPDKNAKYSEVVEVDLDLINEPMICLLYTSDAADDTPCVDLGGRRIIKKKKQPTTP